MSNSQLFFEVSVGGAVDLVPTTSDVVKVGRHASCQLQLDHPSVSRMHAVIEVTEREVTVIDLGSEPQTQLNGRPINKHALVAGDQLQVGDVAVRFLGRESDQLGAPMHPVGSHGAAPLAQSSAASPPAHARAASNPSAGGKHPAHPRWNLDDAAPNARQARGAGRGATWLLAASLLLLVLSALGYLSTR